MPLKLLSVYESGCFSTVTRSVCGCGVVWLQAQHDCLAFVPVGYELGTREALPAGREPGGDGFTANPKRLKRGRQFLWRMWLKGVPLTNADVKAVVQPAASTALWDLNKGQRLQLAHGCVGLCH